MLMHKKVEHILRKILHFLEGVIAILTLIILILFFGNEIYQFFTVEGHITSIEEYLHIVLTIVVGLEFVRMLIDMTPANTLEVLIVAISRQVIISHDDALSNLACVACIAGLFAIRRFLIPKAEMTIEMSEVEPEKKEEKQEEPVQK